MRKRTAARPVLECMENRLVLNSAGTIAHASQAAAARVAGDRSHAAIVHHDAEKSAAHSRKTSDTSTAPKHSDSRTRSSSSNSTLNTILKSVFPGF